MNIDKINELKEQITNLKKAWPAHSVSMELMIQLDELEEELRNELDKKGRSNAETRFGDQVLELRAIGHVENELDKSTSLCEVASSVSRLIIDPNLNEGLQGLEVGQQIMVIFYFHRSGGFTLLQHPHGDQTRPKRGVFALCTPNRPNPIGVTLVDLVGIEDNILLVRGLDAWNGSPVLDLKPTV